VFRNAVWATYFAANLAYMIDIRNSRPEPAPFAQFHYRMGLHCGPVRRFWDQTRWNYIGDGINGGQRVISVIEPTLDDVVFVSETVVNEVRRQSLAIGQPGTSEEDLQETASDIKPELVNRGRRMDKHQKEWRVYQLNHTEAAEW
jgi:class 3 adenylate cyclase